MANQTVAFGLRPIGKVGQNDDNQGLSEYSIAASSDAMYQNDPVSAAATGYIVVTATSTATILGSLNGIYYTDANTSKPTWANNLKAANTATDIVGFVSDDPYERFEIQSSDTAASTQTNIFLCADIKYTAGDSANYLSRVELDNDTLTTTAQQLKILGVTKNIDNDEIGSSHVNWIVKVNSHFLANGTAGI